MGIAVISIHGCGMREESFARVRNKVQPPEIDSLRVQGQESYLGIWSWGWQCGGSGKPFIAGPTFVGLQVLSGDWLCTVP